MYRSIAPLLLGLLLMSCAELSIAQKGLTYEEQVFDFGHVGIDFDVMHTYRYVNSGDKPIKITNIDVPCDCSRVTPSDSVVAPRDTVTFRLKFSTRDLYGPTNKSFTVFTDSPNLPELVYFNQAIVGQWYHYLKPDPISVFLLPGKVLKRVTIPNKGFDSISMSIVNKADDLFDVQIHNDRAKMGESLEFDIVAHDDLPHGTFLSNVTIKVDKRGDDKPSTLTIPVKIVRF